MFHVIFFRTDVGNEPVLEFLRDLDIGERRTLGEDLRTVQIGWPLGMQLCRKLGGGLYEIRSTLSAKRQIARLIFFQDGENLVVVEGFIKKTQKTPDTVLNQAKRRKNEYDRNAAELRKQSR
jgi:phage-related protein